MILLPGGSLTGLAGNEEKRDYKLFVKTKRCIPLHAYG